MAWLGGLVGLGLLLALVTPHPAEGDLLRAVASDRSAGTVLAARAATTLGHLWVPLAAAVVAGLVAVRWHRLRRLVVLLALTLGGSSVVVAALKLATDRPRPEGGLVGTFSSTFPSGHAARAAAVYGLLVWVANRTVRHVLGRVAAVTAAAALVAAIALSRVYLGVHWPSDVLAGALLGSIWLVVVVRSVRSPEVGGRDER